MVARILLLAGAIALIVLGTVRTNAHHACDEGRRAAFAIGVHRLPVTAAPGVERRLVDHCRGAEQLADAASAFLRAGAVEPAGRLAAAAIRREPQRRDSWLAVANVRRKAGDQAGARRALGRARQLDPLSFGG
jgi:cytochrome c-type biogenesis protein CcmH/NrfG